MIRNCNKITTKVPNDNYHHSFKPWFLLFSGFTEEEREPFFNFTAFYLLDFKLQITKTKKSLKLSVLYDDFSIICFVFPGFTEEEREFSQNAILRPQQANQTYIHIVF